MDKERRNRILQRSWARFQHKGLPVNARQWINHEIVQIWNESGDVAMATRDLRATLDQCAKVHGFDPATVILMIRLGALIFEMLKSLGYFSTTEEQLMAILETDAEEHAEVNSETDPGPEAIQGNV